jgi:hypothetical protein
MKEFKNQRQRQTTVHLNNASTSTTPPVATPSTPVATSTSTSVSPNIRHILSNATSRDPTPSQLVFSGRTYSLNYSHCTYNIHQTIREPRGALIDGGANGGLSGADVIVLQETFNTADVTGIADNTLHQLKLCTVAALIQSHKGPIIGIFHQYAHRGSCKTIHSVTQLQQFGTIVDNTPRCFNGQQRLQTIYGYIIPISISSGLLYMDMSPPTPEELDAYPHVFFISDMTWDPHAIDVEYLVADLDRGYAITRLPPCHFE